MGFQRAERRRAKARIAITGPSGSGKSMAALLIAKGIGGKIAAIDTENESLSLYADIAPFDTQVLRAPFTPERYIAMIQEAEQERYDSIIIDSLTHEWMGKGGILEIHDAMPGNSWANWAKVTPRHNKLIEAMLQSTAHIIVTMRSKTEYVQTQKGGREVVEKVGTAPQQRDGMDYEFTLCLDVQQSHVAGASKDRTGLWLNRYEMITVKHGQEMLDWLNKGSEAPVQTPPPPTALITDDQRLDMFALAKDVGVSGEQLGAYVQATFNHTSSKEITKTEHAAVISWLDGQREMAQLLPD